MSDAATVYDKLLKYYEVNDRLSKMCSDASVAIFCLTNNITKNTTIRSDLSKYPNRAEIEDLEGKIFEYRAEFQRLIESGEATEVEKEKINWIFRYLATDVVGPNY